jgi:hypothetical protein
MPTNGLDACFGLVADRRRREIIQQLRHNGNGETTAGDIVDRLYGSEQAAGKDRRPGREELAIQVYHTHLPKLADFGVVDYEPERGTVHYQPDEQVEAVLDSLPEEFAAASP